MLDGEIAEHMLVQDFSTAMRKGFGSGVGGKGVDVDRALYRFIKVGV